MNPKLNLRIALIILLTTFSFSAFGAPKDGAALKKIDEAINVHYLATEFDKAEAMLLGVIKACGTGCSRRRHRQGRDVHWPRAWLR